MRQLRRSAVVEGRQLHGTLFLYSDAGTPFWRNGMPDWRVSGSWFFFFNDTAPTEIYPLSLPDALPISMRRRRISARSTSASPPIARSTISAAMRSRSEEHTSELQSRFGISYAAFC